MSLQVISKLEHHPIQLEYAITYSVKIATPKMALAKMDDILNEMEITLVIPKAKYKEKNIQELLEWAEISFHEEDYYRDLAIYLNITNIYERTIVFTHAYLILEVIEETETDFMTFQLHIKQKEDKYAGVMFGEGLEETYQAAWDKVNNPPKMNVYTQKLSAKKKKDPQDYFGKLKIKTTYGGKFDDEKLVWSDPWITPTRKPVQSFKVKQQEYIRYTYEIIPVSNSDYQFVLKCDSLKDYTMSLYCRKNNKMVTVAPTSIKSYQNINACIQSYTLKSRKDYCIEINTSASKKTSTFELTASQDNWVYAPNGGIWRATEFNTLSTVKVQDILYIPAITLLRTIAKFRGESLKQRGSG